MVTASWRSTELLAVGCCRSFLLLAHVGALFGWVLWFWDRWSDPAGSTPGFGGLGLLLEVIIHWVLALESSAKGFWVHKVSPLRFLLVSSACRQGWWGLLSPGPVALGTV